jgi:hypothetical protein
VLSNAKKLRAANVYQQGELRGVKSHHGGFSRKEKSLRRLSRLRDGLRQQGTVRNGQQIIGVVGPKKAVHITAFFR